MAEFIRCQKCAAEWDMALLRRKETLMCPLCLEPMPELMEGDKPMEETGGQDETWIH